MNYQLILEALIYPWTAAIISGVLTIAATGIGLLMLAVFWPLNKT